MPLRTLGDQGVGEGDENTAADVADKVDKPRDLVVLFRRHSEIRSSSHGNKDKGDGDDLNHIRMLVSTGRNRILIKESPEEAFVD